MVKVTRLLIKAMAPEVDMGAVLESELGQK